MIDKITIISTGRFKKAVTGNMNEVDHESPSGYYIRTDDILLEESTDEISAMKGLLFGIKYIPVCSVGEEIIQWKCRIEHPKLVNPKTGKAFMSTSEDKFLYANRQNFDFFEFEEDWEIQTGPWKFILIEDDRILYEHTFHIKTNSEQ